MSVLTINPSRHHSELRADSTGKAYWVALRYLSRRFGILKNQVRLAAQVLRDCCESDVQIDDSKEHEVTAKPWTKETKVMGALASQFGIGRLCERLRFLVLPVSRLDDVSPIMSHSMCWTKTCNISFSHQQCMAAPFSRLVRVHWHTICGGCTIHRLEMVFPPMPDRNYTIYAVSLAYSAKARSCKCSTPVGFRPLI